MGEGGTVEGPRRTNEADARFLRAVKGYIRKSHVLFAMKEYGKALQAIELVRRSDCPRLVSMRADPLRPTLYHRTIVPPPHLLLQPLYTTFTPFFSMSPLQAAAKDTEGKHTSEIASQIRKVTAADSADRAGESDEQAYARAMRDPEIQSIMGDPVFQNILQQAQNEPASLQQHMQNPGIRDKINKLVRAVSGRFRLTRF